MPHSLSLCIGLNFIADIFLILPYFPYLPTICYFPAFCFKFDFNSPLLPSELQQVPEIQMPEGKSNWLE